MKSSILISLLLYIFCITTFGQTERKTTFRLLSGINYIARTNFQNEVYQNAGVTTLEYHEKGRAGLSFQVLSSFYLSKNWRLNTGLFMDEKGYTISGAAVFASTPAGALDNFNMQETAKYVGIPLEIESVIVRTKMFSLSFDAGLAEQWKISSVGSGDYFANSQLTLLGGLNFIVPVHRIAFIAHPVFRYSPTQLEKQVSNGLSPSYNAYSVGLELGITF